MIKKLVLVIAAFLIALLLFSALAIVPLLRGIQKDSKALETQYLNVVSAALAEKEMAEFLNFSVGQKENFEKLENLFVDAQTPIGFIQFVEEIAATSAIEVRITPGSPKKKKGVSWPVMDFQLASSASYPNFLHFLEKLENGPYLLDVRNTTLTRERSSGAKEDAVGNISFTLVVEVFTTPLP